jgi:hypothetical protein
MAATLDEEKIRDLPPFFLNGQFEGAAAGEVFNAVGKTDILIRAGDRNVFIAECKIWKGPKTIRDALVQLLSYLTWRETKAALLLFIRTGEPTTIITKSIAEIERHTNYKRTRDTAEEGSATTSSCTPTGTRTGRSGWPSCCSPFRTPAGSSDRSEQTQLARPGASHTRSVGDRSLPVSGSAKSSSDSCLRSRRKS